MYRILLIGDPHFKISNSLETSQFHKSTIDYVDSNNDLDFIVVLGDILHCHEKIHTQPFCRAVNFLQMLANRKKTYVLIGNHDRINNNVFLTKEHPFTGMKEYKNLIIVDQVVVDEQFIFVPYVSNGRFKEALETKLTEEEYSKHRAIFAHQEFRGCKMGAIVSEDGDIWEESLPPVFSGHIHDLQKLQNNIFYPGTPFQHGFGDSTDKGIYLLNLNEDNWDTEKIFLDIVPKKLYSMKLEDFDKFKPPEKTLLKINFQCHESTMKQVMNSTNFREKIKKYNISYTVKIEKTKKIIKNHSSFMENLKRRIEKSKEEIQMIFKELIKDP